MTPELIERDWLSFRFWMRRCVLPSCVIVAAILLLLGVISDDMRELNHSATIVGFFTFYYIIVRGGHILMMRSLHFDLLTHHEALYRERLKDVSPNIMGRQNLGFTLARIKREIINTTKR